MSAQSDVATGDEVGVGRDRPSLARRRRNVGTAGRASSIVLGGALLGYGLRNRDAAAGAVASLAGGYLLYRGATGHCHGFGALGVDTSGREARYEPGPSADAETVRRSLTVERPAEELHEHWRDPERLSEIAGRYLGVEPGGAERVRWSAGTPFGRTLAWETRLVEDEPGERLRWESTPDAAVPSEIRVEFEPAPADRGTEVTLAVRWDPPGGRLGTALADRLGLVPATILQSALRRSKSLAETGEVPTLESNPSARGGGDLA